MTRLADGRCLPAATGVPLALSRAWSRVVALGLSADLPLDPGPGNWANVIDQWKATAAVRISEIRVALQEERRAAHEDDLAQNFEHSSEELRRALLTDMRLAIVPMGQRLPVEWDQRLTQGLRNIVLVPTERPTGNALQRLKRMDVIDRFVHLAASAERGVRRSWADDGWDVELGARDDVDLLAFDASLFALGAFGSGPSLWIDVKEPIPSLLGRLARGQAPRGALRPPVENERAARQILDVVDEMLILERETSRLGQVAPAARPGLRERDLARVAALESLAEAVWTDLAARPGATTWSLVDARAVPSIVASRDNVRRVIARSESSPLIAAARARARQADLVIWSLEKPTSSDCSWLEEAGAAELVLFDDLVLVGQWRDPDASGVVAAEPLPFLFVRSAAIADELRRFTDRARRG